MIKTKNFTNEELRKSYNRRSWIYAKTIGRSEFHIHETAIEMAGIKTGEKILEVATGPGLVLNQLARKAGNDTDIFGVDLSDNMLALTRKNLIKNGFHKIDLQRADCRNLPFADATFDLLYNGFMLDIIPENEMDSVLKEFHRVLKPSGRLVLVNMSSEGKDGLFLEKAYARLPRFLTLYIMGGCRPVQMAKIVDKFFSDVEHKYIPGRHPSEIILAKKIQ